MVREKLKINPSVNASTILEVVVSMLMILIVFSIAMTIFANVTRASTSTKQINARTILNEILTEAEKESDYTNKIIAIDEFSIQQDFKPRPESASLVEIDMIAFDANGLKIAELKKVIIKADE